jgi:rubrerythrin
MIAAPVKTKYELMVYAYQMELEAQERYSFLANLMEAHNNTDLVKLFRKMAWIEGKHAAQILKEMPGREDMEHFFHALEWSTGESPESLDLADMDYLMTARQALLLVLEAEKNACKFYADVLSTSSDRDILPLAQEFFEEEKEHVDLIHAELRKFSKSEDFQRDDMDDAVSQD